jgi:hypothetical protein
MRVIFALAFFLPIGCVVAAKVFDLDGPLRPFYDPAAASYLPLGMIVAVASSLLMIVPGAIAAHKLFGRWAAILMVTWLVLFALLCASCVTYTVR